MVKRLLTQLDLKKIQFKDILDYIEKRYDYVPSAFQNGNQYNASHENQGSARVLSFAMIQDLSKEDTLKLFAEHYDAVLSTPQGFDHQNIRQFMQHGWDGVRFDKEVLTTK
ncbi:MAG TPA: HopJ type III effector protein [Sphingobacterium sp.]|nr:HopJ type III effector protein [Sphingobacterium sp.]